MKQIKEFPNYSITKIGKVWNNKYKRWLKPLEYRNYLYVELYKNNQSSKKSIHRLVLETFVGDCPDSMQACHNDGYKLNNQLDNLRWGTHKENQQDRIRHGTSNRGKHVNCGEAHPFCKLTEQNIRMIIYMWRTNLFSQRELAKQYKISAVEINRIIKRKRWKHLGVVNYE